MSLTTRTSYESYTNNKTKLEEDKVRAEDVTWQAQQTSYKAAAAATRKVNAELTVTAKVYKGKATKVQNSLSIVIK